VEIGVYGRKTEEFELRFFFFCKGKDRGAVEFTSPEA